MTYRAPKLRSETLVKICGQMLVKGKAAKKAWRALTFVEKLEVTLAEQAAYDWDSIKDEIPDYIDEWLWLSQPRPPVLFPESAQLCERLMQAKFDVDTIEPMFNHFAIMMPHDFKLGGLPVPGVLVNIETPENAQANFDRFSKASRINLNVVNHDHEPVITLNFCTGVNYYRVGVLFSQIANALKATNDTEFVNALELTADEIYTPCNAQEVDLRRLLFRFVGALIVYCQALPDQLVQGIDVDHLKTNRPPLKKSMDNIKIREHVEQGEHAKKSKRP